MDSLASSTCSRLENLFGAIALWPHDDQVDVRSPALDKGSEGLDEPDQVLSRLKVADGEQIRPLQGETEGGQLRSCFIFRNCLCARAEAVWYGGDFGFRNVIGLDDLTTSGFRNGDHMRGLANGPRPEGRQHPHVARGEPPGVGGGA